MSNDAMKTALITGCTGQDGYFLTKSLLKKNYCVVGCVRPEEMGAHRGDGRVDARVELVAWDMRDQLQMSAVLSRYRPDEFYNLAAYSSGSGMFDDPVKIGDVNGLAVVRILEAIRSASPRTRFCQASSSEMFGTPLESPQNEDSIFNPRSPYGAAKLYAHSMIGLYRRRFELFASSAILFNHESPLRTAGFVSRKVTRAAAAIKIGMATNLRLGDLDARRDWGYADDYVQAMWRMLQAAVADDFVIATGETHSVRELCEASFRYLSLNYTDYVVVDSAHQRPSEAVQLVGSAQKALRVLGWRPTLKFDELVRIMVDADLEDLRNGASY